ncbi:MAG: RIO1 family regulatory kinase/ATPase [Anaerolineales bacterium]
MPKIDFDTLDDEVAYAEPGQRRSRPLSPYRAHKPKRNKWEVYASLEERPAPETGNSAALFLSPGLNVTNEERAYLFEQLGPFHGGKLITGVLRRVKGGKEANVYCCAAHPSTGLELVAAKVYRPRQFRNLKNDSQYRQGRPVLNAEGQAISQRDWRAHKAIQHKSRFGLRATQTSWVAYEFQTLQRLYQAGVDVPQPLRNSQNALLMEYLGEVSLAAPTLHLISLPRDEAGPLFERLIRDVELMLANSCIHGDLSAYNVLYWEGEIKIIDFPQVVDPRANPDARAIFNRDVERLCQYFGRYGVRANAPALARDLWKQNQARVREPEVATATLSERTPDEDGRG